MPGFAGDPPGMPATDVVAMVSSYATHPNYYKYQGRPMLTTFIGQNNGEVYWRDEVLGVLKTKGIDPFFLPQAPVTYKGVRMNSWPSWADPLTEGHMLWATSGTPEQLAATGEAIALNLAGKGKLFTQGGTVLGDVGWFEFSGADALFKVAPVSPPDAFFPFFP